MPSAPGAERHLRRCLHAPGLAQLHCGRRRSLDHVHLDLHPLLAEKRDADARKTFSVVITVMTTVMIVGTILTEIFTPQFVSWMFRGFSPAQVDLTVHLTRILLPAQIFFYVGGVVSAVLLSHRLFLFPLGPLLYNIFIIFGGVIGGRHFGIAALAYGALVGSIVGPFLASVVGAVRIGTGYELSFDIRNPAFLEWVRLSVPLMLGVSLVTADDWILRHYAASGIGDIARLNYAKRLFAVPIAVLGQATGQASLPFFARLFNEKRFKEFATTVNDSVYRVAAVSFLTTGLMMAAAFPLIDLVYRRGRFLVSDTQTTAVYFSGSLFRSLCGRPRDSTPALSTPLATRSRPWLRLR